MPSAITALVILGAVALPDGADAAIGNGWAAYADVPDDGVSTFDPTKITLTTSEPGFDTNGNAVVRSRTITGTVRIRRQWNQQASRIDTAAAGSRRVYFALSEEIYATAEGCTFTATAEPGFYGAAAAGSIDTITNNSTLTYPNPMVGWLNLQHERATGAGFAVEAVAYHRFARNGQQVACIEFTGRDAQGVPNLAAVQRASQPSLSDFQTAGQRVEAWKATIPLANLTQADLCQVNAVVKPWIGKAFDTAANGVGTLTPGSAVDTAQPHTPLRFCCDKTGGYGGNVAYVRAGASGGAVGSPATPFPTVVAALTALATANGSGKGHADHSGSTIFLMDDGAGNAVDHALGATSTAAGKCWTEIRRDPAATAAAGAIRLVLTAFTATSDLLRFHVPFFRNTAGNCALDGGSAANVKRVAFEAGCTDTVGANAPSTGLTYRFGLAYWRNTGFTNAPCPFFTFSSNRNASALVLGCTGAFSTVQTGVAPYTLVGNRFEGARIVEVPLSHANGFGHDGGIIANNLFLKQAGVNMLAETRAIDGFARVQNVFETAAGYTANAACWRIGADGQLVSIANFLSMHNTIPGVGSGGANQGRQNACYTDVQNAGTGGTAAGVQKHMVEMFDLIHQKNVKTDTFASGNLGGTATNTGRTGQWRHRYGVGHIGVCVVTGDTNGLTTADPSGNNDLGEWLPPFSSYGAGAANVTFTDMKAGSAGAGNGTYSLTGASNAAYNRVPASRGVLAFDMAELARRTDGSGAAGAYENTQNPPVTGSGGGAVPGPGGSGSGAVAVQGAGGGQVGAPQGSGSGGPTPVLGSGGGAIGTPGASGSGEAVDAPITTTGTIIASLERTIAVQPLPAGNVTTAGLPINSYGWSAPFDPSDRAPFAIDWSALLADGETIQQIDRIRMSAQAALLGIETDTDLGRTPIISTDRKLTQLWFKCQAAFQNNAAFADGGVQVGVSLLIRTNADPYKQFERTGILTVRQQ